MESRFARRGLNFTFSIFNSQFSNRLVFAIGAVLATLYGGSKSFYGRITYPYTTLETRYLFDTGSYVTNDAVHVSFTRSSLVPGSAWFYLDALEGSYTNASDWAEYSFTAFSNTFENLSVPFDFAFEYASNYNWIAYTDWTPGPAVHTNGVAFVMWQTAHATNNLILTRTGVYTDAIRVAPNPAITNGVPQGAAGNRANLEVSENE